MYKKDSLGKVELVKEWGIKPPLWTSGKAIDLPETSGGILLTLTGKAIRAVAKDSFTSDDKFENESSEAVKRCIDSYILERSQFSEIVGLTHSLIESKAALLH